MVTSPLVVEMTSKNRIKQQFPIISIISFRQFIELCNRLHVPDLSGNPDYKNNENRVKNRNVLIPRLTKIMEQKTNTEWCQIFEVDMSMMVLERLQQ